MIPNNNLSVLPWYTSIEQQNARKWWVYNRVYPLFTPAGFLLPFQVMRKHLGTHIIPVGGAFEPQTEYVSTQIELSTDLTYNLAAGSAGSEVFEYYLPDWGNPTLVYFDNLPGGILGDGDIVTNVLFLDDSNNVVGHFNLLSENAGMAFNGGIEVPENSETLLVQTSAPGYTGGATVFDAQIEVVPDPITMFEVYTANGILVGDFLATILDFITIKPFPQFDYDVIVFGGQIPVFTQFANGQYYAKMSDGTNTWYSEIFTVVNDISGYLKLEWWDNEDFVMDAGMIVYQNPQFKNVLYLCSDIAKPEYDFDDQVIERGGYTFPVQQISKKRYRFSFLASEYLLDVMRFVRMADYAQVTKHGQTYTLDTFLITPEWEDNGDVAAVDAEFTTATVAKKIGVGYIKAQRGDFNDDFNNDYNNQQ